MLLTDVVKKDDDGNELPNTWVTEKQFYAGLGAVQVRGGAPRWAHSEGWMVGGHGASATISKLCCCASRLPGM
jgi:hypothetical protein